MSLKFYTRVAKGLKLKVSKFWGLNLTFIEGTWAWKPKVPGSSPAVTYMQSWALHSNGLANV